MAGELDDTRFDVNKASKAIARPDGLRHDNLLFDLLALHRSVDKNSGG